MCALALCGQGCRKPRPAPVSELAVTDATIAGRLLQGFYEVEESWRWTARVSKILLDVPKTEKAIYLELDCNFAQELIDEVREVNLIATVNGMEVGRESYRTAGRRYFTRYVPVRALAQERAEVQIELDQSFHRKTDGRELGMIVVAVGLKEYERTAEYFESRMWTAGEGFKQAYQQTQAQLPTAKLVELRQLFAALPVWKELRFQGVEIRQNPLDLWMIQQILFECRPEYVVETGAGAGGSALYLAHTLRGMGFENARIVTLDRRAANPPAAARPLWSKYVEFRQGEAADARLAADVARRVRGRRTLVLLNSDRADDHLWDQLKLYAPLVSRGSYLVVQNTYPDGLPPESKSAARDAVQRFLEAGGDQEFETDTSREMLVFTANPGGWLKRK